AESLPSSIREGIRDFCFENAADERKSGETDEQFIYKTRKKALGPFKLRLWDMDEKAKQPIIDALERKFEFLMEKLGAFGSRDTINKYVKAEPVHLPEYAAASAELTAAAVVDPNEGE
ncbi:MAG TPA: aldolase, partial [Thermoanaerobaculia bacterium]|nr:aldolase [Thermoanaerobaculia bacterium]